METHTSYTINVEIPRFASDRLVIIVQQGPHILETGTYPAKDIDEIIRSIIDCAVKYQAFKPEILIQSHGLAMPVIARCRALGYRVREKFRW
jgi:hypothetical protein